MLSGWGVRGAMASRAPLKASRREVPGRAKKRLRHSCGLKCFSKEVRATLTYPMTYSFSPSLTHSLTYSFTDSLTTSLTLSLTHSHNHSLTSPSPSPWPSTTPAPPLSPSPSPSPSLTPSLLVLVSLSACSRESPKINNTYIAIDRNEDPHDVGECGQPNG